MIDITQEDRDRAAVHHGYGSWSDVIYWASGGTRDEVERTASLIAETRIANTAAANTVSVVPTNAPPKRADITREDRELFIQLMDLADVWTEAELNRVRDGGRYDDMPKMQLIARHRLAHTTRPDAGDEDEVVKRVARSIQKSAQHDGNDSPVDYGDAERLALAALATMRERVIERHSGYVAGKRGTTGEDVEQVLRDAGDLLVMPDYSQLAHREMVKRLRDCLVRITGNKE